MKVETAWSPRSRWASWSTCRMMRSRRVRPSRASGMRSSSCMLEFVRGARVVSSARGRGGEGGDEVGAVDERVLAGAGVGDEELVGVGEHEVEGVEAAGVERGQPVDGGFEAGLLEGGGDDLAAGAQGHVGQGGGALVGQADEEAAGGDAEPGAALL